MRRFHGKYARLVLGLFLPAIVAVTAAPAVADSAARQKIESWKKSAKEGSMTAPCRLGNCYQQGNGVKKDPAKAVKWYRLGARRGDFEAALALADMYLAGEGTEQDEEKAIYWYEKLGKSNTEYARPARTRLLMLARSYALGEDGHHPNPIRARYLFSRLLRMEQAGQAEILPERRGPSINTRAKR